MDEHDLEKRIENIAFLQSIGGEDIEYLSRLKEQNEAEKDEAKRIEESAKKAEQERMTRRQAEGEEEIRKAAEVAMLAQKAAEEAKLETEVRRAATQKSYDKSLQEAYPGVGLFKLKRLGYLIS